VGNCKVSWCDSKSYCKGFCNRHYLQMQRTGKTYKTWTDGVVTNRKCSVKGCDGKYEALGYCTKHYRQFYNHGKIFDRTIYDKNEYRFSDKNCKIVLRDKHGREVAEAIIDNEDYEKVKDHKWHLTTRGYVECNNRKQRIKLCNLVFGSVIPRGYEIDHKKHNLLDNRKHKLRLSTHKQNSQNRKLSKANTTGMVGVSFNKKRNKYLAQLKTNGVKVLFKRFKNKVDAMKERDRVALKYYGKFAYTNKMMGLY